jgi:hypothetical protein
MRFITTLMVAVLVVTSTAVAQDLETSPQTFKKNSIGVGVGIPYGVLGSNWDINIAPNLNVSGGFGTTVFAGMGYNFGLKYFLRSVEHKFRPRVSGYYGVNSMIVVQNQFGITDDGTSYAGLSLGFGAQWMWGSSRTSGLDFDLMYILTRGGFDDALSDLTTRGYEVSDPGKIKVSVGYRRSI